MNKPVVILLAEDEEAHAALVRRSFAGCRIANQVIHVDDGEKLLDYLYRRNNFSDPSDSPLPGLVLLDLRLPKLSGMEVMMTIKADPALKHVPVVILTTSTSEQSKAEARALNASGYIIKSDLFYARTDETMEMFCKLMGGE
ncbi:MAG: response regulator [bacterium]